MGLLRTLAGCAVAVAILLATPLRHAVPAKLRLFWQASAYENLCEDLLPAAHPPPHAFKNGSKVPHDRLRLVFVRHGHSVWNSVANTTSAVQWLGNVATAMAAEAAATFVTPLSHRTAPEVPGASGSPFVLDSALYDAPLTPEGVAESLDLARAVRGGLVPGLAPRADVVVVASNLRRAMETAHIGLAPLLKGPNRTTIAVASSMQESCCHLDALSLHETGGPLNPNVMLWTSDGATRRPLGAHPSLRFNVTHQPRNAGDKYAWQVRRGLRWGVWERQNFFVHAAFHGRFFSRAERTQPTPPTIVVVGHSAWFRRFFLRYAPPPGTDPVDALLATAGRTKLSNCGAAAFEMQLGPAGRTGRRAPVISPGSLSVAYGRFVEYRK